MCSASAEESERRAGQDDDVVGGCWRADCVADWNTPCCFKYTHSVPTNNILHVRNSDIAPPGQQQQRHWPKNDKTNHHYLLKCAALGGGSVMLLLLLLPRTDGLILLFAKLISSGPEYLHTDN